MRNFVRWTDEEKRDALAGLLRLVDKMESGWTTTAGFERFDDALQARTAATTPASASGR